MGNGHTLLATLCQVTLFRFVSFGHFNQLIQIDIMSDLYDAVNRGDLERVQVLVEQGADKDQTGGYAGYTPLYVASRNGHLPVVRYLVEQGADMENASVGGWTPVMYASWYGYLDVVRYLLEQGANRDKACNDGRTSLHIAAQNGRLEIAKLLMVYGADINARTRYGQLSIDMRNLITEEIKQAIRDEPRRRLDEAPGKRTSLQSGASLPKPHVATLTP